MPAGVLAILLIVILALALTIQVTSKTLLKRRNEKLLSENSQLKDDIRVLQDTVISQDSTPRRRV